MGVATAAIAAIVAIVAIIALVAMVEWRPKYSDDGGRSLLRGN
jgi:hypothetical protein